MIVAVISVELLAIVVLASIAIGSRFALQEKSLLLDQARARDEARTALFQSMVTPLAWVQFHGPDDRLVRSAMVTCFEAVRKGLDLDSVGMADRLESVPEAPRRLPRYPQVPPYLATPADVAGVPAVIGMDFGKDPTSLVIMDGEGRTLATTPAPPVVGEHGPELFEADGVTPRKIGDDFCPCLPPYPQTWTNLAGTVVCRRCNHPVHQSRYEATQ